MVSRLSALPICGVPRVYGCPTSLTLITRIQACLIVRAVGREIWSSSYQICRIIFSPPSWTPNNLACVPSYRFQSAWSISANSTEDCGHPTELGSAFYNCMAWFPEYCVPERVSADARLHDYTGRSSSHLSCLVQCGARCRKMPVSKPPLFYGFQNDLARLNPRLCPHGRRYNRRLL